DSLASKKDSLLADRERRSQELGRPTRRFAARIALTDHQIAKFDKKIAHIDAVIAMLKSAVELNKMLSNVEENTPIESLIAVGAAAEDLVTEHNYVESLNTLELLRLTEQRLNEDLVGLTDVLANSQTEDAAQARVQLTELVRSLCGVFATAQTALGLFNDEVVNRVLES
ncbi:MAG: hypothetical protein LBQ43_03880, partial [Holosporales bacterium]|nr:hypothetical protein [Holosporales bacterium]